MGKSSAVALEVADAVTVDTRSVTEAMAWKAEAIASGSSSSTMPIARVGQFDGACDDHDDHDTHGRSSGYTASWKSFVA